MPLDKKLCSEFHFQLLFRIKTSKHKSLQKTILTKILVGMNYANTHLNSLVLLNCFVSIIDFCELLLGSEAGGWELKDSGFGSFAD